MINLKSSVFKWNSLREKWVGMGLSGKAAEIAAGPEEGSIYVLAGKRMSQGGHGVFRWAGDRIWYPIPGRGASHIAVGKYGRPYIVQNKGRIFWPNCTNGVVGNEPEPQNIEEILPTALPTEIVVQSSIKTLLNDNSTGG